MIEALGYLWLRPGWLALIPVAIGLGIWMQRRSTGLGAWEQAVDPALLQALRRMGRVVEGGRSRAILPALVLAVLGLALAGPATERRDTGTWRNLDGIVLVLDLSPSITESGKLFDLLTTARLIVESAGTRQTALIVFSGEAYVAAPFSTDIRALSGTLALLDAETMPVEGSRMAEGLTLARAMLEATEMAAADVVVLSDGDGVSDTAIGAAQDMSASGWQVSAVALGQSGEMNALARIGGGVTATIADPYPVVRRISGRPIERLATTQYAMLLLQDHGRFLLLLALIPAFLMLPRGRRA